jgi:hypothetical protein
MTCPTCEGRTGEGRTAAEEAIACKECQGRGEIEIASCPRKLISPEVADFCALADHAADGHLPLAGGTLDQTASFLAALRLLRRDEAEWAATRA